MAEKKMKNTSQRPSPSEFCLFGVNRFENSIVFRRSTRFYFGNAPDTRVGPENCIDNDKKRLLIEAPKNNQQSGCATRRIIRSPDIDFISEIMHCEIKKNQSIN
jgi:hypothetical protein